MTHELQFIQFTTFKLINIQSYKKTNNINGRLLLLLKYKLFFTFHVSAILISQWLKVYDYYNSNIRLDPKIFVCSFLLFFF